MREKIAEHYFREEKENFINNCTQCGRCARLCPVLEHTALRDVKPRQIQQAVMDFMADGVWSETVRIRAYACMECFKCVEDDCPNGLNPLLNNEIIKWLYTQQNPAKPSTSEPCSETDLTLDNRVLASIQVSPKDYQRIFTPTPIRPSRYVFFAGCNVYAQPEKLLTALDLLQQIDEDIAFLPGLDNCCGEVNLFEGQVKQYGERATSLVDRLAAYQPEAVIFWCATCHCRFETSLKGFLDWDFELLSLPQFFADRLDQLNLMESGIGKVTLHEACKAAFTGVDPDGARRILDAIPGVERIEMAHHGADTLCCGGGALPDFRESFEAIRDQRLLEMTETGAKMMVDVCHYCHHVFAPWETHYDIRMENYITLLGRAAGLERDDKYRRYRQLGDLERVMEDAADFIHASPFPRHVIESVLRKALIV